MKVLLLTAKPDRPESAFIEALAAHGIGTIVVIDPASEHCERLRVHTQEFAPHVFRNRVDLRGIRLIRELVARHRPDVIHSFTARALSCAVLATLGVPVPHVTYRGTSGHLSRLDPASWLSYLNPKVSKIVCVSESVRSYLHSVGIAEQKLITIYKGHDPTWYSAITPADLAAEGIPSGALVAACVANVRPVKGVDVLIDALRFVPEELNLHLLLIGELRDSRLRERVPERLRERVHFAGFRRDACNLAAAADIFVVPSRAREGLPKSAIEAMALRRPVVASDVGGLSELIVSERCGLLVPPSDPEALGAALVRYCRSPELRASHGASAAKRIASHFHIQATIERTIGVYHSLIDAKL